MKKKKQQWAVGDVFLVPLKDGTYALGQAVDLMMKNVISCAFFDLRLPSGTENMDAVPGPLSREHLIATVSASREQLDYGVWRVLGGKPVAIPRTLWPNEQFRAKGWIGAKMYDAAIVEDVLNAFYGLSTLDEYTAPQYFDGWLIPADKKQMRFLLK